MAKIVTNREIENDSKSDRMVTIRHEAKRDNTIAWWSTYVCEMIVKLKAVNNSMKGYKIDIVA